MEKLRRPEWRLNYIFCGSDHPQMRLYQARTAQANWTHCTGNAALDASQHNVLLLCIVTLVSSVSFINTTINTVDFPAFPILTVDFIPFFFFFRPFLQFFKITQGTNISSFCASGKAVDLINIIFTVLPTLTSGSEGSFRLAFHPQKKQETGFEMSLSWFKLSNSHWVIYENTMWYMYVC